MIVIRTDHDEGTHYLYAACNPVITLAKSKGFNVISIEDEDINLDYIGKRIKKAAPQAIFFNGHGSDSGICDNKRNEFLKIKHAMLFKGTLTYTRACNCLSKLGKHAVSQGCKAFIGYKHNFWLPKLDGYMSRPLQDPVARPVIECSNAVMEQLIIGKNVEEAVAESNKKSHNEIIDLIYSNDPFKSASLPALINNMAALNFEGDGTASLNKALT